MINNTLKATTDVEEFNTLFADQIEVIGTVLRRLRVARLLCEDNEEFEKDSAADILDLAIKGGEAELTQAYASLGEAVWQHITGIE